VDSSNLNVFRGFSPICYFSYPELRLCGKKIVFRGAHKTEKGKCFFKHFPFLAIAATVAAAKPQFTVHQVISCFFRITAEVEVLHHLQSHY